MGTLAVVGREDFDNGYGGQQIVLDVSYGNDSYRLDFEQVEPQYLSGDWVAKQEGRDYETEFGIADYDYNKAEYNRLADKLVADGVIKEHDEAYKLVMDSAEPYLKDELTPELESRMMENSALMESDSPATITSDGEQLFLVDEVVMSGTEVDAALERAKQEIRDAYAGDDSRIEQEMAELEKYQDSACSAIDKDADGVWRIAAYEDRGGEALDSKQSMAADKKVAELAGEPEIKPAPLTLDDVRELISDVVENDARLTNGFDREELLRLAEASEIEGVGSSLDDMYQKEVRVAIMDKLEENIGNAIENGNNQAEVINAENRLKQFKEFNEKNYNDVYSAISDAHEDLDQLYTNLMDETIKSDIDSFPAVFENSELAENRHIREFIKNNDRAPNQAEFGELFKDSTKAKDYAPEVCSTFGKTWTLDLEKAANTVADGIVDKTYWHIDWGDVKSEINGPELDASEVKEAQRIDTLDAVGQHLESEEHTIQQAGIEGLKSTRSVADMTGTEPDSSVQDKLKEQIERSKFRSESNKETLSEIRGMSPEQFSELTAKMEEKYGKEGHSLTTKGVVEMACEDKLDGLKRTSQEIVALRSADPEKYDRSKAERYVPAYVEPTKPATIDPAVAKAKETGISL